MIATLPRNYAPNPAPLMKGGPPVVSHRPPRGPGRGPVRSASVNTHTQGTALYSLLLMIKITCILVLSMYYLGVFPEECID